MPKMEQKEGLIYYYGNPAGYPVFDKLNGKENAVVDRIFQNGELTALLETNGFTPQWTEGVMERLLAGNRMGDSPQAVPFKKVRIWQLKPETDVYMKFISMDEMEQKFGSPDPGNYRIAYDGQMGTNNLDSIYTRCNTDHPDGYKGHSLSMSDVVELYDAGGSEFHYCDRFGFKEISFEPDTQKQCMEQSMSQSI